MKIHLSQIPAGGLHLEGEEECPLRDIAELDCVGPLRYSLDVGVSDGGLWAQGAISQGVELTCVACLEKFEQDIEVTDFALQMPLPGPETIDLTPFLREDILLNLPPHPRCDDEGERVCPAAGNATAAQADATVTEDKRQHDWGELDKLRLKS